MGIGSSKFKPVSYDCRGHTVYNEMGIKVGSYTAVHCEI